MWVLRRLPKKTDNRAWCRGPKWGKFVGESYLDYRRSTWWISESGMTPVQKFSGKGSWGDQGNYKTYNAL